MITDFVYKKRSIFLLNGRSHGGRLLFFFFFSPNGVRGGGFVAVDIVSLSSSGGRGGYGGNFVPLDSYSFLRGGGGVVIVVAYSWVVCILRLNKPDRP